MLVGDCIDALAASASREPPLPGVAWPCACAWACPCDVDWPAPASAGVPAPLPVLAARAAALSAERCIRRCRGVKAAEVDGVALAIAVAVIAIPPAVAIAGPGADPAAVPDPPLMAPNRFGPATCALRRAAIEFSKIHGAAATRSPSPRKKTGM